MVKKLWLKLGIILAVIFEVILYILYYFANKLTCRQPISDGNLATLTICFPFPPGNIEIILVLIIGFSVGAVIGYLLERFSNKD